MTDIESAEPESLSVKVRRQAMKVLDALRAWDDLGGKEGLKEQTVYNSAVRDCGYTPVFARLLVSAIDDATAQAQRREVPAQSRGSEFQLGRAHGLDEAMEVAFAYASPQENPEEWADEDREKWRHGRAVALNIKEHLRAAREGLPSPTIGRRKTNDYVRAMLEVATEAEGRIGTYSPEPRSNALISLAEWCRHKTTNE